MRGPKLFLAALLPLLAAAGTILLPGLAQAQPATCPAPDEEGAAVVISSPEAGAEVSGRIEVSGSVESGTALFQVELFVGDSRKDFAFVDPPVTATDFTLAWDASAAAAGPATLRVVACAGSAEVGRLVRGSATVDVQVLPSPPAPTRTLVEVAGEDDGSSVGPSLIAGAVIAVPAAAALAFALGRRRSS